MTNYVLEGNDAGTVVRVFYAPPNAPAELRVELERGRDYRKTAFYLDGEAVAWGAEYNIVYFPAPDLLLDVYAALGDIDPALHDELFYWYAGFRPLEALFCD